MIDIVNNFLGAISMNEHNFLNLISHPPVN